MSASAMTPSTPASSIVGDETSLSKKTATISTTTTLFKEEKKLTRNHRASEETMKSGNGNSNKRADVETQTELFPRAREAGGRKCQRRKDALRKTRDAKRHAQNARVATGAKRLARRRKRWSRGCWTANRDEPRKGRSAAAKKRETI